MAECGLAAVQISLVRRSERSFAGLGFLSVYYFGNDVDAQKGIVFFCDGEQKRSFREERCEFCEHIESFLLGDRAAARHLAAISIGMTTYRCVAAISAELGCSSTAVFASWNENRTFLNSVRSRKSDR
jgi:hypothetical protein